MLYQVAGILIWQTKVCKNVHFFQKISFFHFFLATPAKKIYIYRTMASITKLQPSGARCQRA